MVFFYLFRIKENAGKICDRVREWAEQAIQTNKEGDYFQSSHSESNKIHSRRLWRLPGLRHSNYPGIKEAFVILKKNLITGEEDTQYFITNRPAGDWTGQQVLERVLLHWDTETGVFGIKDNTFKEDKVRYFSVAGAMSHVGSLNVAWNCLSAPVFDNYWPGESMNCKMQFWKDNPAYNPFQN